MKCLLTPDCSRAGAVPATQRTSPDPAFFFSSRSHPLSWIYLLSHDYSLPSPSQRKPKILGEVCQTLILCEGGVWERDYLHIAYLSTIKYSLLKQLCDCDARLLQNCSAALEEVSYLSADSCYLSNSSFFFFLSHFMENQGVVRGYRKHWFGNIMFKHTWF